MSAAIPTQAGPDGHITLPDFPALCPFTPSTNTLYRSVFTPEWLDSLTGKHTTARGGRSHPGTPTRPSLASSSTRRSMANRTARSNSIQVRLGDRCTTRSSPTNPDRFGLLASLCYPHAQDGDRLWVCAQMLELVHRICDDAERLVALGVTTSGEEWMGARVIRVMRGADSSRLGLRKGEDEGWVRAWKRLQHTSSPHTSQRVLNTISTLVAARTHQIRQSSYGVMVPDVESYVQWRREVGVAEMAFVLIEYVYELDSLEIPGGLDGGGDELDGVLREMMGMAGDLVSWSSDVYAYNAAQHTGNMHNLVSVLSFSNSLDPQTSIDHIQALFASTMNGFLELKEDSLLGIAYPLEPESDPGWGMDAPPSTCMGSDPVETYVRGLEDCISGFLSWAFETERYFGEERRRVRRRRVVRSLPAMYS